MWVQFLGWEDTPKEGRATHSSTLRWRIPWTEEPGGPQVHRVTKSWTRLRQLSMQHACDQFYKRGECNPVFMEKMEGFAEEAT